MEKIWLKIISNKANPLYWPLLLFLAIVSYLYRFGLYIKNLWPGSKIKIKSPVVSVGNLTVGGTGKTPVVVEIARHYILNNSKVGIVSSGYGRKSKKPLAGTGREISLENIYNTGDELMLMAELLPEAVFAVTNSKSNSALILERNYQPDIIIIDDGFQHRRLHRNLDILLVDAGVDLKKEAVFPLGRLREPLKSSSRADVILITKTNQVSNPDQFKNWVYDNFCAECISKVDFVNNNIVSGGARLLIEEIAGKSVYFFAGIGGFDSLLNHIEKLFQKLTGYRRFPDHHWYTLQDISEIKDEIREKDPEYVITTYKDYVKLRSFDFQKPIYYLDLRLEFADNAEEFFKGLKQVLRKPDGKEI